MSARNIIGNVLTSLLTVCALIVTVAVVRREFFMPDRTQPAARDLDGALVAYEAGHRMGQVTASVTLLVFSDFQCPFGAVLQQNLQRVRKRYPNEIAIVYRHMPIDALHPYAFDAALATECAGEQGEFEAYHDALFVEQDSIPTENWSRIASNAKVPSLIEFDQCMVTRKYDDVIRKDINQAKSLGLTVTPSVIVGSTLVPGTPSARVLDSCKRTDLPC